MKLDILVIAAHPDDAELSCAGTILNHVALGHKVGIVDLTRGELGTRGTATTRKQEAEDASSILGVSIRENLGLADGFFINDFAHQKKVIATIRKYRPEIVLANAIYDRHPDHGRAAELVFESCFYAGLAKIETADELGKTQIPWRPKALYHFIQTLSLKPDFIVDVSKTWQKKMEAIRAYKTQFYDPDSKEPETHISSPMFMKLVEARAIEFGSAIGTQYGEGFTVRKMLGVKSLFDLF
jgi:N-acetylglucosamine malate deacetylase 1